MTDTDIANTDVSPPPLQTAEDIAAFAAYARTLEIEDPEVVQQRILQALLSATTVEGISRAGQAVPAEQVYDVWLRVNDIRASESSYEDGPDLYLHIDATIVDNADPIVVSCGSQDVCCKLIRLHQLHLLPVELRIYRSTRKTKAGYYPVFAELRPVDAF